MNLSPFALSASGLSEQRKGGAALAPVPPSHHPLPRRTCSGRRAGLRHPCVNRAQNSPLAGFPARLRLKINCRVQSRVGRRSDRTPEFNRAQLEENIYIFSNNLQSSHSEGVVTFLRSSLSQNGSGTAPFPELHKRFAVVVSQGYCGLKVDSSA